MEGHLIQYIAQQQATPPSAPVEAKPSGAGAFETLILPFVMAGLFVFMWFTMIRPQRKEEKRKKEMFSSLSKGDSVVTTSGIIGTIATVKEDTVILKVGDGTRMEFLTSAIHTVKNMSVGKTEKSENADKKS